MTADEASTFDRLVAWARERPGTELVSAIIGGLLFGSLAYVTFVWYPRYSPFSLWISAILSLWAFIGVAAGWEYLTRDTDIATIEIDGTIRRDASGMNELDADDVVEAIESADKTASALLVKLNSPGGEPVPAEDIRRAVAEFDGPTVALARDMCASAAYLIATGCDDIYARAGGMVGSIGVTNSQVNVTDLADRLDIDYEQFVAGEYKEAGVPLAEMSEDERSYLQDLIDGHYDLFVDRVAEGRDLSPTAVRDTEARVYLGTDAVDLGLADETGGEEAAMERLSDRLGHEPDIDSLVTKDATPSTGPIPNLTDATSRVTAGMVNGLSARLQSIELGNSVSIEWSQRK